jgi:uncharacterized membrane protein YdjX (TVP38/TMEM64 family)
MIDKNKRKTIFKIIFAITLLLIVFVTVKFFNIVSVYKTGAVDEIIKGSRTAEGVLLFLVLYALRPIFAILPASPMAFAGGAMYGKLFGTIVVVIGALISGTFGFFLARFIGKEYFDRITHYRISKIKSKMEEGSWATVIVLNFIGLPWDSVSIAAGLSKISFRHFFIGIFISSIPQSFIAVYIGNVLLSMRSLADVFKIESLIVIVLIVLGITLPHLIKRILEKKKVEGASG